MLNEDYKEMLQLLLERNCDFLIVGAYALAAHGFPRSTGDIDIFISTKPDNVAKVYQVLADFGAPLNQLGPTDLCVPGNMFQIGVAPCRIDILTSIDGVGFDEAHSSAEQIMFDGLLLPFLSKDCFVKNKLATGRLKDQADAAYFLDK